MRRGGRRDVAERGERSWSSKSEGTCNPSLLESVRGVEGGGGASVHPPLCSHSESRPQSRRRCALFSARPTHPPWAALLQSTWSPCATASATSRCRSTPLCRLAPSCVVLPRLVRLPRVPAPRNSPVSSRSSLDTGPAEYRSPAHLQTPRHQRHPTPATRLALPRMDRPPCSAGSRQPLVPPRRESVR